MVRENLRENLAQMRVKNRMAIGGRAVGVRVAMSVYELEERPLNANTCCATLPSRSRSWRDRSISWIPLASSSSLPPQCV